MMRKQHTIQAACAALALLAATGCTNGASQPTPEVIPSCEADGQHTAGPCSRLDAEAQDKERRAAEQARASYETVLTEEIRLLREHKTELSPVITSRVTDPDYLTMIRSELKDFNDKQVKVSGDARVASAPLLSIQDKKLTLEICQDSRGLRFEVGQQSQNSDLLFGDVQFTFADGIWKISKRTLHKVDSCLSRT